jgi:hypothetical protein
MLTKEIKKGDRIQMSNGWYGTILDNKSGTILMPEIEGTFTERGSVYSFNIAYVVKNEQKIPVEYSAKELQVKTMNERIFGA